MKAVVLYLADRFIEIEARQSAALTVDPERAWSDPVHDRAALQPGVPLQVLIDFFENEGLPDYAEQRLHRVNDAQKILVELAKSLALVRSENTGFQFQLGRPHNHHVPSATDGRRAHFRGETALKCAITDTIRPWTVKRRAQRARRAAEPRRSAPQC